MDHVLSEIARMRPLVKLVLSAAIAACPLQILHAQDLVPRAYVITPVHSNAIILTYSFSDGAVLFDNAIPITNGTANVNASVVSYYHSLSFFGRSANITASLPYAVGNLQGEFIGNETKLYRSGLSDSIYRLAVNIKGGPAMSLKEMQTWRQKSLLGVSLKVVAPTGQYDPHRLINNGSNRWAFKPELGYSGRWRHWVLDAYAGAWFYTKNSNYFSHNAFFPGTQSLTQEPVVALEGHLSYDVKPRLWISLDSNFWHGGRTSLNGVQNPDTLLENSRIGATASIPLNKHQSLKFSYSRGAYVTFGGNFQNVSVAWQYSWLGRPR